MIRCPLPGVPGALFLQSIPGRWETLEEFREGVEAERLTSIVVLLDDAEIAHRSPGYAELLVESPAWLPPRRHVPMEDFGTPRDGPDAFVAAARAVATALREGGRILVHCAAGVGRTGVFAVAVLLALGESMTRALERVHAAGSHPESDDQREFLAAIADALRMD